jgi:molybdopterin-guanine dinucleotide biosynthesis protein A
MDDVADLGAFILAGGKSTRMGVDKAFVPFHGRTLLQHALDLAHSVSSDVRIVGDPVKFTKFAPVVEDIFPGCGPLGGIHAALRSSSSDLNLIIAVDMPFLTPDLLRYLIERAERCSATITVPHCEGRNQPLCAAYRQAFAQAAEHALQQGRYKIDALFQDDSTELIRADELLANGFSAEMFRNLNTPDELAGRASVRSPGT